MSSEAELLRPFNIEQLRTHKQTELDALFQSLPAPSELELDGFYSGQMLAISGLGFLPRFLSLGLYSLLASVINPWKGKLFSGEQGKNILFFKQGGFGLGEYQTQVINHSLDHKPSLLLSYDVENNLALIRPIRGELRKLSTGIYLGQMNYTARGKLIRIMYFTLAKKA